MKLRKVSAWFAITVMLALTACGFFMLLIKEAHHQVVAAEQHRQQAMDITQQLRQETEQLARLVRAYTVTGESRYLFHYYDILAIRQGEKPAPEHFNPTFYWDDVIAGRIKHALPREGLRQSLAERMQQLGFGNAEFSALNEVIAATERMNKVEQVAFAATRAYTIPKNRTSFPTANPTWTSPANWSMGRPTTRPRPTWPMPWRSWWRPPTSAPARAYTRPAAAWSGSSGCP
ncbi:MAG TPA: hypothetical protein VFK74_06675 [Azospira sp.]|nr:hypothetical protein [Azospira sp.]